MSNVCRESAMVPALSIVDQVLACRMRPAAARSEAKDDRVRQVGEFLVGRNVTSRHVSEALSLSRSTAIGHLDELVRQRRATTWTVQGVRWWAAAPAAVRAHRKNTA